jgi:hypothetical protein
MTSAELERLLEKTSTYAGLPLTVSVDVDKLRAMADEILDLREEVLRLRVCSTVDDLIN